MKPFFWESLLDDPPSNASAGSAAPSEGATAAPSASLLSNPPVVESAPAGEGAEGAQSEGGEAPVAGQSPAPAFDPAQLTLPEGITITPEETSAFAEILNGEFSPQERGQKLLDLYFSQQEALNKAGQEAAISAWNTMNEQWREEVRAMPEFAGDLQAKLGGIKQALTTLGADENFFSALDLTGAGNNPHVLRMLAKLTAPYIEGGAVGGETTSTVASKERMLATMYPTMQTKG